MSYMNSFGSAIREARENTGMSRRQAAAKLHVSPDMIKFYEFNKHVPEPELVRLMAQVYDAPDLIFRRCVRACPIGRGIRYRVLNGVNQTLAARLVKYKSELLEVINTIDTAIDMTLNKTTAEDYSEQEQETISKLTLEICDISHNSDEIKLELMRLFGIEIVEESIRKHHSKCYRQGYLKDNEKTPVAQAL